MRCLIHFKLLCLFFILNTVPALAFSCVPLQKNYYDLYRQNDFIFIGSNNDGLYIVEEVFKGSISSGDTIEVKCGVRKQFDWWCNAQSNLIFATTDTNNKIKRTFMCGADASLQNDRYFMQFARNIKLAEMTGIPVIVLWIIDERNIYYVLSIIFGLIPVLIFFMAFIRKRCALSFEKDP